MGLFIFYSDCFKREKILNSLKETSQRESIVMVEIEGQSYAKKAGSEVSF